MDKGHKETDKYIANRFNEYKEFIKDKQVSFVIRKSERIVCGVYMLCQFIPEQDPLSRDLKKTAHNALESASLLISSTGVSLTIFDKTHSYLNHLSSLLTLAFISGYVSGSNVEIMKGEINYLHKHIEELSTSSRSEFGQLQIKSDMFVVSSSKVSKLHENKMSFKKVENKIDHKSENKMSFKKVSLKQAGTQPLRTDDRELRIINVIREKGIVSIKDISSVIFDVSEKTIQRTLQTLIDKGQIKKEGERRWAKYQLV